MNNTPNAKANAERDTTTTTDNANDANDAPPQVIFSGIQPTGIPHLGNYLGALRSWVRLQNDTSSASSSSDTTRLFSIVDLHAITVKQDPAQLRQWRKEMLASFLAVGLDPKKSILFEQSRVPQHAELMWVLSCNASMGYLGRMTQWKAKMQLPDSASPLDPSSSKNSRSTQKSLAATKLGLFSYPVLMAADVLLYGTTHVPVGEDQSQHLEFTREVAIGFNHSFPLLPTGEHDGKGGSVFIIPQTILSPAKRVMSLKEPNKKMSKSDADPKSRILITDAPSTIEKKIRSALTDSIEGITYDRSTRPGVSNLIELMLHMDASLSHLAPQEVARDMKDLSMRALKELVANSVNKGLEGVRERYEDVMSREGELERISEEGAERARALAEEKMRDVRRAVGLL